MSKASISPISLEDGQMTSTRRSFWLPGFSALMVLFLLAACGGETANQNPTPTPPSSTLTNIDLGIPGVALNSPVVGPVPDDMPMHVTITFKVNQEVMDQIATPGSEDTDLATKANELGITDEQYEQIKAYVGIEDAKVTLGKLHTNVTVDAKASTFAKLLNTTFQYHKYNDVTFYAPGTVAIPSNIASLIQSITGLDNYTQTQKPGAASAHSVKTQTQAQANCGTRYPDYVFANDLRSAYGLDGLLNQGWTGKGVTIILPEFAPLRQDDVNTYLSCVGYRGKLSVVTVKDAPPVSAGDGDMGEFEVILDVQMIAGLAPDANIVIYQMDGNGQLPDGTRSFAFHDVLQQVIDDNTNHDDIKIMSLSWGYAEPAISEDAAQTLAQDIQILTQAEHISVFAATGDCGAYASEDYPNTLAVGAPASSPYAIGVGGTHLQMNGNQRGNESVWSAQPTDPHTCNNTWGSTGGLSTYFQKPKWQDAPGLANNYSNGARQVPDVAAIAENISVFFDGQWTTSGGTSAAAPIWAAGMADVLHQLAYTTKHYWAGPQPLYRAATSSGNLHPFNDIQQGDNLYYKATNGWDYATGLGSPNFSDLYQLYFQMMQDALKK
jgi:kumamolisin